MLSISRQAQAGGKLDLAVVVVVVVVLLEQGKFKQVSFVTKPGAVSGFSLKASPFELFSGF